MRFENKVIVVTGASRGIGFAIADGFASEGAQVAICARGREDLETATKALERHGRKIIAKCVDLANQEQCEGFALDALRTFGRVDVLVNNAGTGESSPVIETPTEAWTRALDINLTAPFILSKCLVRTMIECGGGNIVNISSIGARKGGAFLSAYCASKAALIALTQSLASEVGRFGVRVNAVCPGAVRTQMFQDATRAMAARVGVDEGLVVEKLKEMSATGELVTAEQVARAVMFLCSEDAMGITGASLDVALGQSP